MNMDVIVKHTESIKEYLLLKQKIQDMASRYANQHMNVGQWVDGEPVKAWKDKDAICIEYASGKIFHYKLTSDGIRYW